MSGAPAAGARSSAGRAAAGSVPPAPPHPVPAVHAGMGFAPTPPVAVPEPHAWWTLARAAVALGDLLQLGPRTDHRPLAGVGTDTRSLRAGDLFVALRGDTHDGHAFLAAARDAGAAALLVDDVRAATGLGLPVLVVRDTRAALGALARAWRRTWGGPVVAVAGANGKTSTKELLRAALGTRLAVHATAGNLNNEIGVPLTLLALPPHAAVAVVEIGTNAPGEVARLRAIAEPDIAVVTSIGEEHLEGLGSLAGVLAEESAVCDGVALAVVPAAETALVAEATRRARAVSAVVLDAADHALADDGRVQLRGTDGFTALPLRGAHHASNAALALAVGEALGVPRDVALGGMAAMAVPAMRGSWESLGRLTVINDAYNANPPSVRAALALLDALPAGRPRLAVLGTMRELGVHEAALHDAVARDALATGIEHVVATGTFADAFARVAPGDPRVTCVADVAAAWPAIADRLVPGAVVLLKGSRGVRLERFLPDLSAWAAA